MTARRTLLGSLFLVGTLSLAAGCSDSPVSPAGPDGGVPDAPGADVLVPSPDSPAPVPDGPVGDGSTASACAALDDQCLAQQKVCVVGPGGPACQACGDSEFADRPSKSCRPLQGKMMQHDYDEFTVQAGEEVLGLCQSWTLNNAEEVWVNAVVMDQNAASHHSNWTFVPGNQFEGPDGVWRCADRNYNQLAGALAGGVLYAQSTQATHEVQKFAPGAAVRIPPYSRIIGDVHLLNPSPQAVTGRLSMRLYTLQPGEVEVKLVPFHLSYEGLDIPARSRARFTGECNVGSAFRAASGVNFAPRLFYILPHTHSLASAFFVEVMGGPLDGQRLVDLGYYDGLAHGRAYDPGLDLTGATGFRFGCEYDNPRDERVGWGYGDQEMCELLGFMDQPVAFESTVDAADPAGNDGSTQLFTGACNTVAFPFDQDRPGGPPPSP